MITKVEPALGTSVLRHLTRLRDLTGVRNQVAGYATSRDSSTLTLIPTSSPAQQPLPPSTLPPSVLSIHQQYHKHHSHTTQRSVQRCPTYSKDSRTARLTRQALHALSVTKVGKRRLLPSVYGQRKDRGLGGEPKSTTEPVAPHDFKLCHAVDRIAKAAACMTQLLYRVAWQSICLGSP